MKGKRYIILVAGKQHYKQSLLLRKAKLKAEYLRSRGFYPVEIVEVKE